MRATLNTIDTLSIAAEGLRALASLEGVSPALKAWATDCIQRMAVALDAGARWDVIESYANHLAATFGEETAERILNAMCA